MILKIICSILQAIDISLICILTAYVINFGNPKTGIKADYLITIIFLTLVLTRL